MNLLRYLPCTILIGFTNSGIIGFIGITVIIAYFTINGGDNE